MRFLLEICSLVCESMRNRLTMRSRIFSGWQLVSVRIIQHVPSGQVLAEVVDRCRPLMWCIEN